MKYPILLLTALALLFGCSGNTFTDERDGKVYKYVKIGEQTWMAENLNYEAEGSKCYNNEPDYCKKYGRLYNWQTAMKACPNEWHLPSNEEWDVVQVDFPDFAALLGGSGNSSGNFFQAGDLGFWWTASEEDNADYFRLLIRKYDYFHYAYLRFMEYDYQKAAWAYSLKTGLHSIRCVRD